MQLGDSFIVPKEFIKKRKIKQGNKGYCYMMSRTVYHIFERQGMKIITRRIDKETNTHRCWRIK